jgi:hypothetical protein
MRRYLRVFALTSIAGAACGPESPAGTSAGTSGADVSTSTTGEGGSTGTQAASTSTTVTPTSADTTEAIDATTTSSGTETTSDTDFDTTTDEMPWGECAEPYVDWDKEHVDCMVDWPTMTAVHGEGPATGLVSVTRIYFAVDYYACTPDGLTLGWLVIDDPTTPTAVLYGYASCGPERWIGEHDRKGEILGSGTPIGVTMTIDGFAGDWISADPIDPPRILGSFTGDLVGPFEAIHCAALDTAIWNCG